MVMGSPTKIYRTLYPALLNTIAFGANNFIGLHLIIVDGDCIATKDCWYELDKDGAEKVGDGEVAQQHFHGVPHHAQVLPSKCGTRILYCQILFSHMCQTKVMLTCHIYLYDYED